MISPYQTNSKHETNYLEAGVSGRGNGGDGSEMRSMRPDNTNRTSVPNGASNPAATNTGTYEKWSTTQPVPKTKIIEPMPAPVPPKPATEATALSEKKSLGKVCTLLIQT